GWSRSRQGRLATMRRMDPSSPRDAVEAAQLSAQLQRRARRLRNSDDLDPLMEQIGEARYVLLGEASHGTAEYYGWRTAISRRLIRDHGFSFVAVEGDWPDCFRVNRWVKGRDGAAPDAASVLRSFDRWPTWMWANTEV